VIGWRVVTHSVRAGHVGAAFATDAGDGERRVDSAFVFFGEHLVEEGRAICDTEGVVGAEVTGDGFAMACRRCLAMQSERLAKVKAEAKAGAKALRELAEFGGHARAALEILRPLEQLLFEGHFSHPSLPGWTDTYEVRSNLEAELKHIAADADLCPPFGPTFAEALDSTFGPDEHAVVLNPEAIGDPNQTPIVQVSPALAAVINGTADVIPAPPREHEAAAIAELELGAGGRRKRAPIGSRGPRKKK
jgi:hypothetical protein